ncbi:MAG: trehalose-6-phosphate synthase [Gemmatimonadaceae bacterium]
MPAPRAPAAMSPSLDSCQLILVSNREPYEHVRRSTRMEVRKPAGGLVSALDPTMRRAHGVWVAWGSGSGDRETADARGRLAVPPDDPSYTLRRVWLDAADVDGYYQGFANSALWPLCHMLIQHFHFRTEYWERYKSVNRRFAEAVADEATLCTGPSQVWIQDYHFALVAEYLRAAAPSVFVHQFWHIPFPPPDILHMLPSGTHEAVLRGLLGNDLIEFHTERYAQNFLDCVDRFVPEAHVDSRRLTVHFNDRTITVGAFPISVDVDRFDALARSAQSDARVQTLRRRYASNGRQLGVAVDRVDYTKGIPQRLRALDVLWTEYPETREQITFIFVATPSRTDIPAYRSLEEEVTVTVRDINRRFAVPGWTPIVLIHDNVDSDLLAAAYRAADLCLVSSLQDGMNLVAKEFVACQTEERGVLVLSRFTGAAEEIEGAVLINPFNIDGFVNGIREALGMPLEERQRRIREMRAQLRTSTIFDWMRTILARADGMMGRGTEARLPGATDAARV